MTAVMDEPRIRSGIALNRVHSIKFGMTLREGLSTDSTEATLFDAL